MTDTILLKKNFNTNLSQQLIEDIQFNRANYYYFLGKIADSTDTIIDSIESENNSRAEMVAFKKITSTDVSYVIPRIDWDAAGRTVYAQYDSTIDMTGMNYYVMTDTFDVFKCISNAGDSVSLVKPTKDIHSTFWNIDPSLPLSDGYVWKYMFNVPLFKRNKFISELKIPVQNAIADRFYNSGSISSINVISGGSGYVPTLSNTIVVEGDGTGAVYKPVFATSVATSLVSVAVTNGGMGYTTATATLSSSTGSGAVLSVLILNGVIFSISVLNGGINYSPSDTIVITGNGSGVIVVPSFATPNSLANVIVVNSGTGYTYATATLQAETGMGAELSVVLAENDYISDQSIVETTAVDGGIFNIKVTNSGNNYTTATVTITGDGTGCTAVPVLSYGNIVGITITNVGLNYTYANVTITGDNLTNNPTATSATAYAIISPQGGHGKNAVYELNSTSLCFFSNIRSTLLPQQINQDFREYGIIKNLNNTFTGDISTNNTGMFSYTVTFEAVGGSPVKDEVLQFGESFFRVVDIVSSTEMLITSLDNHQLVLYSTLYAVLNNSRTYTIREILSSPDGDKYSGKILFISNSDAFNFSGDQEVTIKTYLNL